MHMDEIKRYLACRQHVPYTMIVFRFQGRLGAAAGFHHGPSLLQEQGAHLEERQTRCPRRRPCSPGAACRAAQVLSWLQRGP